MQLFIDILLVGVFALPVIRGLWRGFFKTVLGLGRLVLSVIAAILVGPAFSAWLDKTFFHPAVYNSVYGKLSVLADEVSASAGGGAQAFADRLPEAFRSHLDLSTLDPADKLETLAENWSRTISEGISGVVSSLVGYVLLFVVCFVLLTLLIPVIGKIINAFSLVRKVDKLLGLLLGLVSGVIAVMLISVVLGALLPLFGQGELVDDSIMLRLFSGVRAWLIA